jgi:hypothetical protein
MRPNRHYIQQTRELAMSPDAPKATYQDVDLILRLYEMRRETRMREARRWFATHFKAKTMDELNVTCPPGSEPNASYRMLTSYWEMVASFVTSGVLNQELFFQSNREFLFVWERIRDLAPQYRKAVSSPVEWKNLETVSAAYVEWWNQRAQGAYDAFVKRVRG